MTRNLTTAAIAVLAVALPVCTLAQKPMQSGMDHGTMMNDPSNPYAKAEADMHMRMMAVKTGDAAEKWTRKMIEHHRGALAMSRAAIAQASDRETKRMAQMTIDKQEKDIAELQGWLRSHGKPAQ